MREPTKLDIPPGWAALVVNEGGHLVALLYSPSTMPRVTVPVASTVAEHLDIVAMPQLPLED